MHKICINAESGRPLAGDNKVEAGLGAQWVRGGEDWKAQWVEGGRGLKGSEGRTRESDRGKENM